MPEADDTGPDEAEPRQAKRERAHGPQAEEQSEDTGVGATVEAVGDSLCCLAEAASSFDGIDCFLATASLQPIDPHDHPDLNALRAFRDRVLSRSMPGRIFTRFYYRWGRYAAQAIQHRPVAKFVVRNGVVRPGAKLARWWLAKG